jgi:hypothetical protein
MRQKANWEARGIEELAPEIGCDWNIRRAWGGYGRANIQPQDFSGIRAIRALPRWRCRIHRISLDVEEAKIIVPACWSGRRLQRSG